MVDCKRGTKKHDLYILIQDKIQDMICVSINSSTNGKIDSDALVQLSISFTDKIMEEIEEQLGEIKWKKYNLKYLEKFTY